MKKWTVRIVPVCLLFVCMISSNLLAQAEENPVNTLDELLDYRLLQRFSDLTLELEGEPIYWHFQQTPNTKLSFRYDPIKDRKTWTFYADLEYILYSHTTELSKQYKGSYFCLVWEHLGERWIEAIELPKNPLKIELLHN